MVNTFSLGLHVLTEDSIRSCENVAWELVNALCRSRQIRREEKSSPFKLSSYFKISSSVQCHAEVYCSCLPAMSDEYMETMNYLSMKMKTTEAEFIISAVHAVIRKYSQFMLWSQTLSLLRMRSKIMQQVFHDFIVNCNIRILWPTHNSKHDIRPEEERISTGSTMMIQWIHDIWSTSSQMVYRGCFLNWYMVMSPSCFSLPCRD